MDEWKFGPPILVGERVVWVKNTEKPTVGGVVRWIGKLSKESNDWTVGVELDKSLPYGGTDGTWGDRRLFHCSSRKGVFLPLSRIRKEMTKQSISFDENFGSSKGRKFQYEEGERLDTESIMERRTLKEVRKWTNNVKDERELTPSSDSDDEKSDTRKISRRRRKPIGAPRVTKDDSLPDRTEPRRPISVTERIGEDDGKSKWQKKHESCALEEKYIREFIQREINKQQNLQEGERKMNDVKGNFKRIDEDEIHSYDTNRVESFDCKPPKKLVSRRNEIFHRREKSNGFFSFLKWFKKSKEMPELEAVKDCSVTSSPLFIRRRSSSCGSVDTLFSIATATSFAFVSPVQYQAVISSSHTTYPVTSKIDEDGKSKNQSDYENNPIKDIAEEQCSVEKRKKCRAPDPPSRDISLPSTLEFKKDSEEEELKGGHRRTVSESFKDKKAGFYCHVQGKRKAPLPPPSAPLYPSLTSLKSQCPSINKKKRPAPPPPPPPPDISGRNENVKENGYDNLPNSEDKNRSEKEVQKPNSTSLSPLLGLTNGNSSSPLPSRPWYKRNSSVSNLGKKDSTRFSDRKKNKENEEWMPEVGFSRRPISNESGHNLFNLLTRLDRNSDKKKEEKRKSQISILANISELDREAAEIVRKEHAQEKKMMADKDEKYYSSRNILDSFPSIQIGGELPMKAGKPLSRTSRNPFDEFKPKNEIEEVQLLEVTKEKSEVKKEDKADASAELDYYINPWNCPKCTFENFGWEKFCEACFTMRVKFRSEPEKTAESKQPEQKSESKMEKREESLNHDRKKEAESLEEVRRKRIAFFTAKESGSSDRGVESVNDETSKLKMMLKEMKDSLPKCEKGVINKTVDQEKKDDGNDRKDSMEANNLNFRGETSGEGDQGTKVQQTWQPNASDPNKYGAVKKTNPAGSSTAAEAIIMTKTTVLEDIIVKKAERVSTSVQTNSTVKNELQPKVGQNCTYANVGNIKDNAGVVDLAAPENTFPNDDIEVITANLQKEGSIDYKIDIQATSSTSEMNTLGVNRLLRKLEATINNGQHLEAASIAKELARMKVSCSVKRQKLIPDPGSSKIVVDLYVEDKTMHKGPIQIQILPSITLGQLKMKVEREWEVPRNVQRWILGKQLATDDEKTLEEQGIINNSYPLFLYIVTPEQSDDKSDNFKKIPEEERRNDKVPINVGEARRPSLIVEEGESGCEEIDDEVCKVDSSEKAQEKLNKAPEVNTPGAQRREIFRSRNSPSSLSFEKREMNENLKKELKAISTNSVKERIEKLNRAATGGVAANVATDSYKFKGENRTEVTKTKWHYNELMQLENADLVPNVEDFECPVCLVGYAPGEGVILKDCLHIFCRDCLINTIQFNEEAEVKCPYRDEKYSCESVLQQREIKSLVPKGIFEQHLAKSVSVAENNIGNAYHCKTPDCTGWCILEDNVNEFRCPVCRMVNCLTCQSIHSGMNCRQYQEQIRFASDTNVEAKKTRDMLQEMVEKGEAMACPTCQVVLMKKWGCDWLRCSMCKTEICWVTRGPRWGPGGKGDTSGGCQCGVNGIKCHPKCNYCH